MIQDIFPHQFKNEYKANQLVADTDWLFYFENNQLLLKTVGEQFFIPRKKDFPALSCQTATFLFTLNESSCFLISEKPEANPAEFDYKDLNFMRTIDQPEVAWTALAAFQLMNWYKQNKFCGKCGSPLQHKTDERALVCPSCKNMVFPKISPAVITAIICGDKILLARNASFTNNRFALIAGYVDVGETLEQAVRREIKEEVGLEITKLHYYKSQPWPLSGSLMVGFVAEADDQHPITIDNKEIVEAGWFARGHLPNVPNNTSIAGEMIEKFEKGELSIDTNNTNDQQLRRIELSRN
ncbi:NAD(+) diphosphatase [Mangrovibacterium marinum]|uniref:NAD(+) diphosphatase n=1 Tax=Mangrovibacterium marinum TaxID=1639118 RepID=A0A2T5C2W0_9BACT|nr:NAD(+) diphosphatase [Mangrovibacterium marinum]PTN09074.1 NAD+ diphosphatase [Mangrovibacterium marinum]